MDFETFKEEIKEQVREHLPEKYKDIRLETGIYQKLNQSYEALMMEIPNQDCMAAINLEALYKQYEDGLDLSSFYEELPRILEPQEVEAAKTISESYEKMKPRLGVRLNRIEGNEDILQDIPHEKMEDLAMTYHVLIKGEEDGASWAVITNQWMESLGITKEQLHKDAIENSPKLLPVSVKTMGQTLMNLLGMGTEKEDQVDYMEALQEEPVPLLVVTNQQMNYGASSLFYPEVMENIANQLGGFYILPSSVHETLIMADSSEFTPAALKQMVTEVNMSEVSEKERLTDEVYHYDSKDKIFEKADKFMARQQIKQMEYSNDKAEIPKPKKNHDMSL